MKSRNILLKKSRIYLILNRKNKNSRSLEKIFSDLCCGGVDLIQLRDKGSAKKDVLSFSLKLSKYLDSSKTLFIINDYADVALLAKADGVHLGQDDLSVKKARKILGRDKIIGVSCHTLKQAVNAQKDGADYIGIGPVYPTPTKPMYKAIGLSVLRRLKGRIKIPYFAIGDIHSGNIKDITASGARRIAVCRAILKAKNPKLEAKRLNRLLIK
ncbi:MAG: thiamine phosphate synthase [Candidatus Omnitrophota bacterium]